MKKSKKKHQSQGQTYALVYSTDPVPEKTCSNCRRPLGQCACLKSTALTGQLKPAIRIERKGRGGKDVTVISKLPAQDHILRALLTYLKRSLGSGGTYYIESGEGVIEVQGQNKDKILELISKFENVRL